MLKTSGRIKGGMYYRNERRKAVKDSSMGFYLYKNNRNTDGKTAKNINQIIEKDSGKKQKPIEKSVKKR